MTVFLAADGVAHLGVHQQMRRLILFVPRARKMHVRQLVEREDAGLASTSAIACPLPGLVSRRIRRCPGSLGMAWRIHQPWVSELQTGERHAPQQTVFEGLMHMLHRP